MSLIPGYKLDEPVRRGLKTADATFKKYGSEVMIRNFINEGRDGTEITKIMDKIGGNVAELPNANKEIPEISNKIDLRTDFMQIVRESKVRKVLENKVKKIEENVKQRQELAKQAKGEAINE